MRGHYEKKHFSKQELLEWYLAGFRRNFSTRASLYFKLVLWQEEELPWRYFLQTFCAVPRASWDWSLHFCFWRVLQGIVQLILCCFGPSLAEMHAPCSGMAHGELFWSQGIGSTWPCLCKRVRAGQDTLVEAFLWCNETCSWMFIPFLVLRSCGSPGGWGSDFLASFLLVIPIWS